MLQKYSVDMNVAVQPKHLRSFVRKCMDDIPKHTFELSIKNSNLPTVDVT